MNTSGQLPDQEASQHEEESLREEFEALKGWVTRLDGYREGTLTTLRLAGLIIAAIGVIGIVQLANAAIEGSVKNSVDARVQALVGDLDARIRAANDAVARAENAVGRADAAAQAGADSAATSQAAVAQIQATPTSLPGGTQTGQWTNVISSELTLENALQAKERALSLSLDATIYKVGEYFATTAGRFSTKEDAEAALVELQAILGSSAYPLEIARSCPFTLFYEAGFYGCFLEAQQ